MKRTRLLLWGAIGLLIVYMLFSSLFPNDRNAISKLVEKGRVAIEQEDLETLMSIIDLGYKDELGLTYLAWKNLYAQAFEKYENIRIRIIEERTSVDDDGQKATVTISARGEATLASTMGDPQQAAYRPVGGVDETKLIFKKTITGWKLTEAKNMRQDLW